MTGAFEVASVEETWALARRLAAELKPGDVVCLEGDLGAGKTTFTQGLAAALGVSGRVTSPTFCIVQEHRLQSWEDYLAEGAILVVEWPERAGSLIPPGARHIVFTHLDGEESRRIVFS